MLNQQTACETPAYIPNEPKRRVVASVMPKTGYDQVCSQVHVNDFRHIFIQLANELIETGEDFMERNDNCVWYTSYSTRICPLMNTPLYEVIVCVEYYDENLPEYWEQEEALISRDYYCCELPKTLAQCSNIVLE